MSQLRKPTYDGITDERVRDALQALQDFLGLQPLLLSQFQRFELTLTAAVTDFKFTHNLGFKVKDIITTWASPSTLALTWKYESFTNTEIVLTTTGPMTVRFFAGAYDTENV